MFRIFTNNFTNMENPSKLFLLDAYALIYRAYYAFIRMPRINSKGMNTSAILGFVNTLEEVLKKENPSHIGIAFDPAGPTFRHEAYPEYKAQREATPEDIKLSVPLIKDIIRAYRIPILEEPGYEADDVIGTLATQAGGQGINTYMLTPDKDYGQLVGGHVFIYRPKHGGGFQVMGVREVTEKYGIENTGQVIDLLGLMGDASDNIPGCPGVGEVTAVKLIKEFGSIDNLLAHTDALKGALRRKVEDNAEQIRFSKFLATIKTDVPIALDLPLLERKDPDAEALSSLFRDLEFKTLADRVLGQSNKKPAQPVQGDLFGGFATDGQEGVKVSPKKEASQPDLFSIFPTEGSGDEKNRNLKALNRAEVDYQLADNQEKRAEILKKIRDAKILSLDTETTSTEPMRAQLVGFSLSVRPGQAFYIPVPPEEEEARRIVGEFAEVLQNPDTLKVGQNIKYDLIVLQNYGARVGGPLFDTMLAHYVLQPELRHNMDYLAEIYLGYQTIRIEELLGPHGKNQKNMRDLDPAQVYLYACEDADVALRLKEVLEQELQKAGVEDLFYHIEMPLVPVLACMELNGVRIDTEALRQTSEQFAARLDVIEQEIYQLAGETFNIASPKQVGHILFEKLHLVDKPKKTKTGQYVTSEEVLQSLHQFPIVEKILAHRGLKKLLGTYVDALPELINPRTGRIHTSFNQAVTVTGRLSSSDPNLQNIPVRDADGREIRKAFIPDDGCEFFAADYSQIELRIMAHLSGDQNMIEAFAEGEDIHAATAAKIFKVPVAEVTKDMRRKAKTANFGIIYGISVFGLAERMEVSRTEARGLIDGYFATYPRIKAYMEESVERARTRGFVETIFHRKRFLPDINSHNAVVRGYAERNAINAPIQGSAADIIKVAMARIYQRFCREGVKAKMLLQVHDELTFSVPPEEKEVVRRIVTEEMESAYRMSVPLKVDGGFGKNWLEAH